MVKNLEINHLRTLDALYQSGSVSMASETLSISQQAVSSQLKHIRNLLGDKIFVRSGHGMIPTEYGLRLKDHVQNVLEQFNNIPVYEAKPLVESERQLVICSTDYGQTILVPLLVKAMRCHAPKVKIIVTNIENVNLTKKMHQGLIDIVFTTSGYVPAGLNAEDLFTEKYVCVSSNKNINTAQPLPLKTLMEYDFLVTSPGTASFNGSVDAWLNHMGLKRNVVLSAPSFYMAKKYLVNSDMVGLIPSRLLPQPGLVEIPLEKSPPGFQMVAAYHPNMANDSLIHWLINTIKDNF